MAIQYHYSPSSGQEVIVSNETALFYPRHMHMCHWTLGFMRRGMAELEIPGETRQMDTGNFFLVQPLISHALRIAEHSELLVLCFDEKHLLRNIYNHHSAISHFLLPQEATLFEQMVDQLVRAPRSSEERKAGGEMRTLAQRLISQPDEALSIIEMARIAHVSPWHFLRRFQSEIGMTPHAFLLNCRVRHLRSLLRDRVAAADAAALAGFTDQSHMHKLFKLHHSLTPRQFILANIKLDSTHL